MLRHIALVVIPAALVVLPASAIDNGLGLTPPLGWRSYNAFGGAPTQALKNRDQQFLQFSLTPV